MNSLIEQLGLIEATIEEAASARGSRAVREPSAEELQAAEGLKALAEKLKAGESILGKAEGEVPCKRIDVKTGVRGVKLASVARVEMYKKIIKSEGLSLSVARSGEFIRVFKN